MDKYSEWIAKRIDNAYGGDPRRMLGQCRYEAQLMEDEFPELNVVRGHVTPCLNGEKVYKVLEQGGPEALRKRMIEDWPALEWARTDPRRNVFEVQTESSG